MTESQTHVVASFAATAFSAAVFYFFHDRFWWPPDEGVYAYVAQRALAGDVLHRDLIDLHGGYGNLINVTAFRLFGNDLLSLRYPLVLFAVLQCFIAYFLFLARGAFVAFTGSVTVAGFSFVQFLNPSANWHALLWFFALALLLEKWPKGAVRLVLAGIVVGLCFFTRQLSGVFLGLGLFAVLLVETRDGEGSRCPGLVLGGIGFLGLFFYLLSKQHLFGMVWAGFAPLLLLLFAAISSRLQWEQAWRITVLVLTGFVLAGLPLVMLTLSQGAFTSWLYDIFVAALTIHGQSFIAAASFGSILEMAWLNIVAGASPLSFISGVAWFLLILSVPALGLGVTIGLRTARPIAILGVFWSVGALHYQIPIYLFFVLPAVLLALLALWSSRTFCWILMLLSSWALVFQAAHPLERGLGGVVAGEGRARNVQANLPHVSLKVPRENALIYRQLLDAIEADARPGEALMTLPMNPELNFMTERKSPARFYGTPLGLLNEENLADTISRLDAAAPLFVVHRTQDKYLTPLSASLLATVQIRSDPPLSFGPFDLYRYHAPSRPGQ